MIYTKFGIRPKEVWIGYVIDQVYDKYTGYRVKAQVHGFHDGLKPEEIPWSLVMTPATESSRDGSGLSINLPNGTQVFGVWVDQEKHSGVIIGTINAFPEDDTGRLNGYVSEPDANRLARAEKLDQTSIGDKNNDIWSLEPQPPREPKYPYNKVWSSNGLHTVELDDTEGMERVSITSSTGAFVDMTKDSLIVKNPTGDVYIAGQNVTIEAKEKIHFKAPTISGEFDNGDFKLDGSGALFNVNKFIVNAKSLISIKTKAVLELVGSVIKLN